jgi:cytochrome P450
MYPVVAPFLTSYHQVRKRFALARKLLVPLIEVRRNAKAKEYPDVLQWLVQSSRGCEKATDEIVKRMLFLNMAAISTSGSTATNVLLDLCSRPDDMAMLREEMLEAVKATGGITLTTLASLKKTDSFIGESRRVNSLGLMTFSRELMVPFKLSNGVTLPAHTYISMTHQPMMNDPVFFPSPETFDGLRFFKLRQKDGQEAKHQFAQLQPNMPNWGVGKFACPGRFWASAQIKLVLMVFLLGYDISFPDGQSERPENIMNGENYMVSRAQQIVLKRRE